MGLSSCAKGFIACGVCFLVALAVMIPVGLLVIAPKMGQHALDSSVMTISNATMWEITWTQGNIYNNVTLTQTSLPFSATLKDTDMVMHIPAGGMLLGQWNATNLGHFHMPEQKIVHGDNHIQFSKERGFLPFCGPCDAFTAMSNWAMGLMFPQFMPEGATLYIVGRPKLQALGVVHLDLKLGKNLSCTSITPPPTEAQLQEFEDMRDLMKSDPSEETVTVISRRLQSQGLGPMSVSCVENGNLDSDLIDELLGSFDHDLVMTTTTTTTPAPAPVPAPAPAPAPAPSMV